MEVAITPAAIFCAVFVVLFFKNDHLSNNDFALEISPKM